jgi:hypothetical protein
MSLRCPATLSCCRGRQPSSNSLPEWESKQAQEWQTGRRSGSSSWRRDLVTPPNDFLPQATCCRAPRRRGGAVTRRQPFRSWECGSSSHKPPVGVLVGEPVAPAIELILLRDTLKTELRHRALANLAGEPACRESRYSRQTHSREWQSSADRFATPSSRV